MPDLIQNVPLDFTQLRASAAEATILARRLTGEVQDDTEARNLLKELLKRVKNISGPLLEHPDFKPYERLDSEKWNRFFELLQIDLRAIYDSLATLEAVTRQMETISKSDLTLTKAAILKAISQLEVYQFLKDNPEYQDLKLIDFVRSINDSPRTPGASIDNDIRMLELPAKSRQVVSTSKLNERRTRVSTKIHGTGKLTGFGNEFKPANLLDPNPGKFWVEVLSSNTPVVVNYEASWGNYTAQGMVAEVMLDFSHVERVNNLKFLPFSEFPYDVIDVAYKESSTSAWTTIPFFEIKRAVEDWVEFDFPYIAVDKLRISIAQPNYTRNISLIPEAVFRKNQLWSQLRAEEYSRNIHELDLTTRQTGTVKIQPEQIDKIVALTRLDKELEDVTFSGERADSFTDYTKYIDAIGRVVDEIAPGAANEVREITLGKTTNTITNTRSVLSYDYLVGIRSLALSSVTYEPLAYYESPKLVTNGTVVQAQLDTVEIHPEFKEDDGVVPFRRTSIEYEIEVSPDTRFPVVPVSSLEGANYVVRDEWIKLTRGVGRLRFQPIAGSLSVRKNSKRISMLDVTLSGRDITIANADTNAIYTVTYNVDATSTYVNVDEALDSTRLISPEEFLGTDSDNKITLSSYPYIIYEIVRDNQFWTKKKDDAIWEWNPDFYPLSVGSVALTNASTAVDLTKDDAGDPDFDDITFSATNNLAIWIQETNEILDIDPSPPVSPTDVKCYLTDLYAGSTLASSRFILGRKVTHDNRTFGLNTQSYEPIVVYVNGIKAINKTDYLNRQHPAFDPPVEGEETVYEYIQAGRNLYFNRPVSGKITVAYSWLTKYIKLVATLRCHVPVATIYTPKLDKALIRVKTTEL